MEDPFDVAASGRLTVACQIIQVEHVHTGTVIDLITLDDCDRGLARLPAGTPLALILSSPPMHDVQMQLESIMSHWETGGALLDLEVDDVPGGLRYQFSAGAEQLTLMVTDDA